MKTDRKYDTERRLQSKAIKSAPFLNRRLLALKQLIYRCSNGHISFARRLFQCGMKGCERPVDVVSEIDIDWFYKISPEGLSMKEDDLHKILGDRNMPKEVKDTISKMFPGLKKKSLRFW